MAKKKTPASTENTAPVPTPVDSNTPANAGPVTDNTPAVTETPPATEENINPPVEATANDKPVEAPVTETVKDPAVVTSSTVPPTTQHFTVKLSGILSGEKSVPAGTPLNKALEEFTKESHSNFAFNDVSTGNRAYATTTKINSDMSFTVTAHSNGG